MSVDSTDVMSDAPANGRTDSYIMLTPRGSDSTPPPSSSSLAKELLTRPSLAGTALSAKESATGKEVEDDKTKDSPTETEKSSEVDSEEETPEPDTEDLDAEAEEIGVFPTYLCELHDPKTMLTGTPQVRTSD
jgi:hypothetical protein